MTNFITTYQKAMEKWKKEEGLLCKYDNTRHLKIEVICVEAIETFYFLMD